MISLNETLFNHHSCPHFRESDCIIHDTDEGYGKAADFIHETIANNEIDLNNLALSAEIQVLAVEFKNFIIVSMYNPSSYALNLLF